MASSNLLYGPQSIYRSDGKTLGETLFACLRNRDPNEIVNEDIFTKETLTCGRMLEESTKLSVFLTALGVKKGDVIGIASETTIDYFNIVLGAFYLGVTANTLNFSYTVAELERNVNLSKPKILFASETALEKCIEVKEKLKFIRNVILIGKASKKDDILHYGDILQITYTDLKNFKPSSFDPVAEVALILYSSGTTDFAKGVRITHENLKVASLNLIHPTQTNITKKDVIIHFMPFFHIYGCLLQTACIMAEAKCVMMSNFNPTAYLRAIEEYKPERLFVVSTIIHFFAKAPVVDNYNLSSLKYIFVGTAPLSKKLQEEAAGRLLVQVLQMYGMTEVAGPSHIQLDPRKSGSVGKLMPGIVAKVVDPETAKHLVSHQIGEICLKGEVVMKGYIPEVDVLDYEGFLHTGDIGYYDNEDYFYIVDRIKDMIKYKGFQVSPAEIDAIILSHRQVKDCGVIGIPNERAGEVPMAYIVLEDSAEVTEKEIIDYVEERSCPQKRLYGGIVFVDSIPKSPIGKVLRRKLRQLYENSNYSKL